MKGKACNSKLLVDKSSGDQNSAAIKIQSLWRGYYTRKVLQPLFREWERYRVTNIVSALLYNKKKHESRLRQLEELIESKNHEIAQLKADNDYVAGQRKLGDIIEETPSETCNLISKIFLLTNFFC